MAKSNKHSRTNCRHPAFLVLLHPIRFNFAIETLSSIVFTHQELSKDHHGHSDYLHAEHTSGFWKSPSYGHRAM
jgi:hypothetical protein